MEVDVPGPGHAGEPAVEPPRGRLGVPSRRGKTVLLFVFVTLVEYWVAPPFLGITNFAGIWSAIGNLLLAVFLVSLAVFVVVPLAPHLRRALRRVHAFPLLVGITGVGLIAGLAITNALVYVPGASVGSIGTTFTTLYSPFGALPSLVTAVPGLPLVVTLNVENVGVLGLLSFLWAAAITVARSAPTSCPTPNRAGAGWRGRLALVGVWGPFGLVTGCPSCAPAYVALVGVFAPTAASDGYAALPITPWIGLAGLLYLVSFALAIRQISRITVPPVPRPATASMAEELA